MEIKDREFHLLVNFMRENYGLNLEHKRTLIEGRLGILIKKLGFKSFEDFVEYVLKDKTGEAITLLTTKLTTNYTYFYREEEHYKFLSDVILPGLVNRLSNKDLRIWSAGCSSGEEPYTIAITIDRFFGSNKDGWDTRILATDISKAMLDKASAGIYSASSLEKLPQDLINKYFTELKEGNYQIREFIKDEVIFRYLNLMEPDFPFRGKFHVIFCRNVMIYFNKETRQQVVQKFYDVLDEGGYLIIGHSESLNGLDTKFNYVKPSIYRKE